MAELYELDGVQYERVTFGCCGVTVLLPEVFIPERRKTGETFYCPNGHPRVYKETELDRARKQLESITKQRDGEVERLSKLKLGKCPWCWKTVKDLSGHIKRNHT